MKNFERTSFAYRENPIVEVGLSLLLGVCIGALVLTFLISLRWIEHLQTGFNTKYPIHLILMLPTLFFLDFFRKKNLYFPSKVFELNDNKSAAFWSRWMAPFQWVGALFSQLAGASVGREEATILYSAGVVRLLGLSWALWGPILMSAGFGCILGNPWVAPVFMFEFFRQKTNLKQKIYSFIAAYAGVLILQSFQIHRLFENVEIQFTSGIFSKFVVLFFMALVFGLVMRLYKSLYAKFLSFFQKSPNLKWLAALLLMLVLAVPQLRGYQGIGLVQFSDLSILVPSYVDAILKLSVTFVSNGLGFLGGEFAPFLNSGAHLGAALFQSFGLSAATGSAFGAYLLFAGATRMKWTTYVLMLGSFGFGVVFWAYFVVVLTSGFAGDRSLYEMQPVTSDTKIL